MTIYYKKRYIYILYYFNKIMSTLKKNFLFSIFSLQDGQPFKYSKAYLNLKSVIELEEQDGYKLPNSLLEKFISIQSRYKLFLEEIPLSVIEKFYHKNLDDLNKHIYISYEDKEINEIRIVELFVKLEDYFNEIYSLASLIANFYNIEVKINKNATGGKNESKEFI